MVKDLSACIFAPTSIGELIDKITILQIKCEVLTGDSWINAQTELNMLQDCAKASKITPNPELVRELKIVNQKLWRIEDQIREQEKNQDFGSKFIDLARSVYKTNDRRSEIKRSINISCGSHLIEEKSYEDYS